MLQPQPAGDALSIWDLLIALPQQPSFRRIVVIGAPGSGKTTLLEHLTLTYAQRQQRRSAPRLIPVLLYLRDLREAIEQDMTLAQVLDRQEAAPPDWFAVRLQRGRCLVMLDGLDEVASSQQVSQWVDRQMQRYPTTSFILTSRPFGYRAAPLQQAVTVLEVQPFTVKQMRQFIHNWYLQSEIMQHLGKDDPGVRSAARQQADDLIGRIQRSAALAAMAVNPLLLTMIATVHRYRGALPGRRVELYAEMCDVLLGRRQEAKGVPDVLTAAQKQSILQVLALNRMRKESREFTVLHGSLLIQKRLVAIAGDRAPTPEAFLQQVENVSGLLVEKEAGRYEFAHKSLQEYLAAVQIKETQQEFLLTRQLENPGWEETIRLYAAQSDVSNLIAVALQIGTVAALTLAYDCLTEGLSVDDQRVRRRLEVTLEQGLESNQPELFKLAAEVRLQRRLKHLIRIDDTTEIDPQFITCAEYQLFIDEQRLSHEQHQPDHWTSDRFPPGMADQPIVGVRAEDAAAFCEWLTQHNSTLGDLYLEGETPVFVGEFRFRLPTVAEVKQYPGEDEAIGCWCQDGIGYWRYEQSDTAGPVLSWRLRQGIRVVRSAAL